jgi:molybdate transport system regulatory protein
MTEPLNSSDKAFMRAHLKVASKIWFELDGKYLIGPGDARLITVLQESKNLTIAAKDCGYSYKYAWKKLKEIERKTGQPIVTAKKGGYGGGGAVEITVWGQTLLQFYLHIDEKMKIFVDSANQELDRLLEEKL